ncbi:MAG: hypothetical protein IKJ63_02485, partial [Clostridia bacterium]|nr:hypothetical protein [Clostridia bacterium]
NIKYLLMFALTLLLLRYRAMENPRRGFSTQNNTQLFCSFPALFCGKGISPVATGDNGRCPLTPQVFEKT